MAAAVVAAAVVGAAVVGAAVVGAAMVAAALVLGGAAALLSSPKCREVETDGKDS